MVFLVAFSDDLRHVGVVFVQFLDQRIGFGRGRLGFSGHFGLAHSPPVFWNPAMLEHFLAGIQYAIGDLKADATPSAKLGKK